MAPASSPPIPRQTRQESRRKAIDPSMHLRLDQRSNAPDDSRNRVNVPPASPEVISSLITSLAVISKPANQHFDHPSLSVPSSPGAGAPSSSFGSFGVDYGAYNQSPALHRLKEEDVDLDELAASSPTIRTSKPPSGYSAVTAPKSPRSPRSPRRESSGGLRSLLRSSRPSSKGSGSSHNESRSSIGNLSIEPGFPPTPDLRKKGSQDSWGRKQGRSYKGLHYMSSKERLRASASSAPGSTTASLVGGSANKADTLLAEIAINEEPGSSDFAKDTMAAWSPSSEQGPFSASIPTRESSLRKTGSNAKRSSYLSAEARRRSESGRNEIIQEDDTMTTKSVDHSAPKRRHPKRHNSEADTKKRREDILTANIPDPPKKDTRSSSASMRDSNYTHFRMGSTATDDGAEEGAPFPSVYSSRRRSTQSAKTDRRKSGRQTPDPTEVIKTKRSSSRLKRLSAGTKSPEPGDAPPSPTQEKTVGYERPQSADSVDDAVESYLCSARLSQKIRHPQTGRIISFSEVGDPDGSAVFCCVGMGLTRYIMAFYDELALTLKLRLITPDRPGVGDSEAYADGTTTPLSWPDDVYAICQSLKITKFSILAHSAGAIYALATALRMPQHIRGRIHLLAPWIPPSQMNTFGGTQATPPTNAIPTSQKILRALPTPFLKAANSSFMTATSSSLTSSLPKNSPRRSKKKTVAAANPARDSVNRQNHMPSADKENITNGQIHQDGNYRISSHHDKAGSIRPSESEADPEGSVIAAAADALAEKERQVTYDTRLTHSIWDLATTGANPAVDLLVCLERRHTIGFRYVDITRPVVIHHGSRDTRVPVDNVRWLGTTMRRCEVRVLEGEGHGLMASAAVMGAVLMEISKEWEDWMRVTGASRKEGERGRSRTTTIR